MNLLSTENLQAFWSDSQFSANLLILMNILGALILGMILGYERSYHGRAAGIRTYGLVCMASSAITVIVGFPHFWYGGLSPLGSTADPTRVIQGIVTGIGFLGAGVIMKEGLNISGLTTAASIWASSAIGILCGSGFYFAAIALTFIATAFMTWGGRIETLLPSRHAVEVILRFQSNANNMEEEIKTIAEQLGFHVAEGAIRIVCDNGHQQWHLVFIAKTSTKVSILKLAATLEQFTPLDGFQVAFARN